MAGSRWAALALAAALVALGVAGLGVERDYSRAEEARLVDRLDADASRLRSALMERWRSAQDAFMDQGPEALGSLNDAVSGVYRRSEGGVEVWDDNGWRPSAAERLPVAASEALARYGVTEPRAVTVGGRTAPEPALDEAFTLVAISPSLTRVAILDPARALTTLTPGALADAGLPPADVRVTWLWRGDPLASGGAGPALADGPEVGDRVLELDRTTAAGESGPRSTHDLLFFGPTFGPGPDLTVRVSPAEGSVASVVARGRRGRWAVGGVIWLLLAAGGGTLVAGLRRSEALARRQRAFLEVVGHEIRTPLAAMDGALQNLEDGVVTESAAYLPLLRSQVERMRALADDALTLARARTDGAPDAAVSVRRLMDDVERLGRDADDVTLDLDPALVDAEADLWVGGREGAVARALANLVRNGRVHGEPPIVVSARRAGGGVTLEVRDHGPGFGPGDAHRLLQPFVRGKSAEEAQRSGSGLGLAVVAEAVREAGGTVTLDDASPGARVRIFLPEHAS